MLESKSSLLYDSVQILRYIQKWIKLIFVDLSILPQNLNTNAPNKMASIYN